MDSYWWLSFRSTNDSLELDQNDLFEAGATGIEELENGANALLNGPMLKSFFGSLAEMESARLHFQNRAEISFGEEKVEDWDRSWRDRQTPVEVTPSLVVLPPWVAAPPDIKYVIRLEAKMAFGTGSHESTRIAAMLLERVPVAGASVLDIGTGTGILGIYASILGADSVVALDNDPVVGPCLNENLILNPPPDRNRFRILIGGIDALATETRFGVVICNMIRTELWPFREQLRSRLAKIATEGRSGVFVISGQRLEDKPHFLAWKESSPFRIVQEVEMDGWWGFAASVD